MDPIAIVRRGCSLNLCKLCRGHCFHQKSQDGQLRWRISLTRSSSICSMGNIWSEREPSSITNISKLVHVWASTGDARITARLRRSVALRRARASCWFYRHRRSRHVQIGPDFPRVFPTSLVCIAHEILGNLSAIQAVSAEFSGYAGKFRCFLQRRV